MTAREAAFRIKSATVRRSNARYLRELLEEERMPAEVIRARQLYRAAEAARAAAAGSDFYRRTYREQGVQLADLADPDSWLTLPVIDRATVKAHADEIAVAGIPARFIRDARTGGSTGEPLRTRHDTRVPSLALAWRMYAWWGVRPWDDLARLGRWNFGRWAGVKNMVAWFPTAQLYLDASLITPESLRRFHAEIVRVRPALIEGYVGGMIQFAAFLEAERLTLPGLVAVATTAAPLPFPVRRRLEAAFGAPVYDEYRSSEMGWVAGECTERNGLHVFAGDRLVEALGEDGVPCAPGEVGDLVITDLTNRVFPLIRYRVGDRGALREDDCPCGVRLPLMDQPEGRTTDLIRLPGGAVLNHRLMAMFSGHPEAVRLFQIHQTADYAIRVRVVAGAHVDARTHVESAVEELRHRISAQVPVVLEYVESLPYTGGKTKYVISDIDGPDSTAR